MSCDQCRQRYLDYHEYEFAQIRKVDYERNFRLFEIDFVFVFRVQVLVVREYLARVE